MTSYPTQLQAAEPALSKGVMWYSGLYVNDSFRMSPKLTINAGVRWEQPGSFTETHGRLGALLMNLPQPAVTAAMNSAGFSGTYTGGLGLINSSVYTNKDWQTLNWKDFSRRVGVAWSPNFVPNGDSTNPNYPACAGNPNMPRKPSEKITAWFNPNCYQAPSVYQFGNEPRVDPYLRAQGIDNTDLSIAKDVPISEAYKLDFRVEAFNLFNWTQFSVPSDYADSTSAFGKITAQYNSPRAIQMSARFTF